MIKVVLTGLLLISLASSVFAQDAISRGKKLSTSCTACHGKDGNSTLAIFPKLAGQKPNYLLKQLNDIQSGKRKVVQMQGMLTPFNQQDLSDIAAYFAQKTISIGRAKPSLVDQGGTLFRFGDSKQSIPACAACHGPAGQGINSAVYPSLSGQHALYTLSQLKDFQHKKRTNDPNKVMQAIAKKLSTQQMNVVADYLQGLKER